MKKFSMKRFIVGLIGILSCAGISAQTVAQPTITNYDFLDQSCIHSISDNGKWAVSFGAGVSNTQMYTNARLINIETGEVTVLGLENDEETPLSCAAYDVTDDGMVVGEYKGKPATWTKATGWKTLDLPIGRAGGMLECVTPDGKFAVGRSTLGSMNEQGLLYDLTTGEILDTPGVPTTGSNGEELQQVRFTSITGDGRYIDGTGDFSYTWNTVGFIYDRQESKCIRPGYNDDGTPVQENIYVSNGQFSPNGKWYVGAATVYTDGDEYDCPFRYNMETKQFDTYEGAAGQNYGFVLADNEGNMYAATPPNTPVRTLYIFVNGFWYPMDDLMRLRYDIDIYGKTGYDNTGTCVGISGDGKVLASFPDPYRSYVVRMNETFSQAALNVNLLKDYTATPADGAAVSSLKTINLRFKYDVALLKDKSAVHLKDKNGNDYGRLVGIQLLTSGKEIQVTYRSTNLTESENYTLTIDAGTIALKSDASRINEDIVLHYTGRAKKPVEVETTTPENGSSLSQLSISTNPVFLYFDTDVKLADGAKAYLYRDDETESIAELQLATSTNAAQSKMVLIYPATTQNLYKGSSYRIVVPAGAVTDSNGDNPTTQDYTLTYEGAYNREIAPDDGSIYSEDFAYGVANMLLRDGDGLTPDSEMQGYDFQTGDAYAWVPVRDDGSTDFAAASTSSYSPAGKSDDWMVTPQIYIPDEKCRLDFDAQGFRSAKNDKLKVIVYADETIYNYLTADLCTKMRTEGKVLMDEVVLPGASDTELAGDWTPYSFKLEEYAGKNIYVAFVNENEGQSLVIVDNIKVVRDNGFLVGLSSETSMIGKTSAPISGRVIVNVATGTISDACVKLLDADKNVIDEVSATGLELKKGDEFPFSFTKELPLTVGRTNTFYLSIKFGEYTDELPYAIENMAFQTTKRVIIEENTGMDCVFCPQGHYAWDRLSSIFGDKVIMAAYHCYTGDMYESGMSTYVRDFLGLSGAPTAMINRNNVVASPMYRETREGKYYYNLTSPNSDCWLDVIQKEMESMAVADLNITASYSSITSKVSVPFTAKFALDMEKQNIGLFIIVTEDGLTGYQKNTFASQSTDNTIGIEEWCQGGIYGQGTVYPFTQNHVSRAHIGTYFGDTKYLPQTITNNQDYTGTIEFNVPSTVQDINNCNVICMMIDANTGRVLNNATAKIINSGNDGIEGISTDGADVVETARYNAAGQLISGPQKGINIIKYSNGTIQKVLVK